MHCCIWDNDAWWVPAPPLHALTGNSTKRTHGIVLRHDFRSLTPNALTDGDYMC